MNNTNIETVTPDVLRKAIEGLGLDEKKFAILLSRLGDRREASIILKSVISMISGDIPISAEMSVILTLLQRERSRASRIAETLDWENTDDDLFSVIERGVKISIVREAGGRWAIYAKYIGDGSTHSNPAFPHWRNSCNEAKIRAVLAVDEMLDYVGENSVNK